MGHWRFAWTKFRYKTQVTLGPKSDSRKWYKSCKANLWASKVILNNRNWRPIFCPTWTGSFPRPVRPCVSMWACATRGKTCPAWRISWSICSSRALPSIPRKANTTSSCSKMVDSPMPILRVMSPTTCNLARFFKKCDLWKVASQIYT